MAKFIQIVVGSTTRTFSAENVITTERTAATTTTITYNSAQAGFDVLTLTHSTDANTTKVVDAINNALFLVHSGKTSPNPNVLVTLPTGVTVSAAAFA